MSLQFVTKLSEQEVDQLSKDFLKADVNNDGSLDLGEFKKLMADHIHVEDQVERIFECYDTDKDGKLQIKEFLTAIAISTKGSGQEKLEALFKLYDLDGNGVLTPDEIEKLLSHLKQAASKAIGGLAEDDVSDGFAKGIVNKLDRDHDGKITKEEWVGVGQKTPSLISLLGVSLES